ncbi:MAG TPA: biopolymer transporter ExbD [Cytophagales bacterium]|nr:biopolymer transporter ExbD [Cytophagales bacterium]
MNLRKHKKGESEVSTHSLNDIMFFLMLFFLIASAKDVVKGIKLNLPKANTGTVVPKKPVSLSLGTNDDYYIDDKKIAYEEIKTELRRATQGSVEPTVVIRMDSQLPVQKLVSVMEIGTELNIKMLIAADKKP